MINELYGTSEMMRIEDFIKRKFSDELIFFLYNLKLKYTQTA